MCYYGNGNEEGKYHNIEKGTNYISADINIEEENVGEEIRIINSSEEIKIIIIWKYEEDEGEYQNEYEIKDNCTIKIIDGKIGFKYLYTFEKKGTYTIKYIFTKDIENVDHMFFECEYLTNIDLSNFNTQNVTDMSYMFFGCHSLTNIDLSNFNTQNVTDMSCMFEECHSLTNIDLSNFNTQNVANMSYMFAGCKSLTEVDLSNFNTQNVTYINYTFCECHSLKTIVLSNSNAQTFTDMNYMYFKCNPLMKKIYK